ncbi:MAG: glycogen synthase [Puniceicoccales bacterium]|jgi:starch synthase|nr:glycogen synthase [Puniceicoccales bacterium]
MRIAMISPECTPWAQTGGLADAVVALARSIAQQGHDVRVFLPLYDGILEKIPLKAHEAPLTVHLGMGQSYARLWECEEEASLRFYFIEYQRYFQGRAIYADAYGDYSDNPERFVFFTRAVLDACYQLPWIPHIFHAHDWTTGLLPVYLETVERDRILGHSASVLTIHNLQHHGYAPKNILDFAGIPWHVFRSDAVEAYDQVHMLKAGLYFAQKLTTVSPRYAQEIQTPDYGHGLDSLLRFRAADLIGICNGIDTISWNPQQDSFLNHPFDALHLKGKHRLKQELYAQWGWESAIHSPCFAVVSRFCEQKGLDLLANIIQELIQHMALQIVILGQGDGPLESQFRDLAQQFPQRCHAIIGFDTPLSHRFLAASDFIIMPSRFEPCGLTQLYAMHYGSLPIVRETGGLADTVENYDEQSGNGTGFVFRDISAGALYDTIGWACSTYYDRPQHFSRMQQRAMHLDLSWDRSSRRYLDVYRWAREAKGY